MSKDLVLVLLIGAALGLVGGLIVSRFGVKKGYGPLPGFVVGFVVTFGLGFLPLIVFVIGLGCFIAAASKFPERSPGIKAGKRPAKRQPAKTDKPGGLPGWGDN